MKCDVGLLPSSIRAGKRIEFHEDAATEYEAAIDWYFERSRSAAEKFTAEINRAVESIAKSPRRWPATCRGRAGFSCDTFPAVVYRELPASIQILAVAHGHRRPGYWKSRL
jgi:plasmid stabilization system protein ParE